MAYTSKVVVAVEKTAAIPEDVEEALNKEFKEKFEKHSNTYYIGNDLIWYSEYKNVETITKFIESTYKGAMIVLGESYDDNTIIGDISKFLMYISRDITIV